MFVITSSLLRLADAVWTFMASINKAPVDMDDFNIPDIFNAKPAITPANGLHWTIPYILKRPVLSTVCLDNSMAKSSSLTHNRFKNHREVKRGI